MLLVTATVYHQAGWERRVLRRKFKGLGLQLGGFSNEANAASTKALTSGVLSASICSGIWKRIELGISVMYPFGHKHPSQINTSSFTDP